MGRYARSLRRLAMFLSLSLTAAGSVAGAAAADTLRSAPMPDVLHSGQSNRAQRPFWVDASQVLTKNGQLNSQLLGPEAASDIARLLAAPEKDGCIQQGEFIIDRIVINGKTVYRSSLDDAFRSAAVAMRGRVTGRSTGFQGSFAGTLIRFEPVTIYKDNSRPRSLYYTFMPVSRLQLGSKTICKTDRNYAEVPEVGDEIVLLQPDDDRSDEQFLDAYDGAGIVTIKRGGRLALPLAFRSATPPQPLTSGKSLYGRLQELMEEKQK